MMAFLKRLSLHDSPRDWFRGLAVTLAAGLFLAFSGAFGTDETPTVTCYQTYYRGLETADEYFEYAPGRAIPPQGRWRIYGLYLPDDVLEKVYLRNAERLLGLPRDP